jgi:hypothetical protein
MDQQQDAKSSEEKYGLVILLDALGVSNFGISEAISFAKKRDELIRETFPSKASEAPPIPRAEDVFTFGDTVLITYPIPKSDSHYDFSRCLEWICSFFYRAVREKIFFRGAISLGDYFINADTNTVIGPAVSEAAAWYEKHDWMGIVATPSLTIQTMHLASYAFRGELHIPTAFGPNFSWLSPYSAPRSKISSLSHDHDLLVLDWSRWGVVRGSMTGTNFNPSLCFYRATRGITIPFGAESKYLNTTKFIEWSTQNCTDEKSNYPRSLYAKRVGLVPAKSAP